MTDSQKVTIIDMPCGAGKTSWAIQEMNKDAGRPFVYVTPFLNEIERVRAACGWSRIQEPQPFGGSKLDDFNELLAAGANIATTHSTFLNATDETLEAIREGEYILICDEVLEVVQQFNDIQAVERSEKQAVSKADIEFLLFKGIIQIEPDNKVTWLGGSTGDDFKFGEVKHLAELKRLYCMSGVFFVVIFPPAIFEAFRKIYILTYKFEGYTFKPYLERFGIGYCKACITQSNGIYSLEPYTPAYDYEFSRKCSEIITICDDEGLNDPGRILSRSWFNKASKEQIQGLKANIRTFFDKYAPHAKADAKMWTTYKDYKDVLKGPGYTQIRPITREERKTLSPEQYKQLQAELSCFVPCNARATNKFRKRWALVYACNYYPVPFIRSFFRSAGVEFDDDAYALANLIQWVCRSRIRDGEPIVLYLPSRRMRKLFTDWLKEGVTVSSKKS